MLQGTIKSFDAGSKAAVVLTDAREQYEVPPEAFRRSGLRALTLGQRVKFLVEGEGDAARVTYVNILTLPDPE
ncbi:MAG TPA: cold-shock protein [Actinomycetes bacterium]|jgi:cold shock CspA family protein|nr:cold-shock protein [Actinomycetes bacterium]